MQAAKTTPTPMTPLFIQALNDVSDQSEKRLSMLENRVPPPMWIMLMLISFFSMPHCGNERAASLLVRDDDYAADDFDRDVADCRPQ